MGITLVAAFSIYSGGSYAENLQSSNSTFKPNIYAAVPNSENPLDKYIGKTHTGCTLTGELSNQYHSTLMELEFKASTIADTLNVAERINYYSDPNCTAPIGSTTIDFDITYVDTVQNIQFEGPDLKPDPNKQPINADRVIFTPLKLVNSGIYNKNCCERIGQFPTWKDLMAKQGNTYYPGSTSPFNKDDSGFPSLLDPVGLLIEP